jgi:isopentenyl-diphosphate delta-isomerase
MEYLLTVDENDNVTGLEEKVKCHMGDGILHRAFLLMAYDGQGRLILARRSPKKMLWPGYWDGTVASHPREGEEYVQAALLRLEQELGVKARDARLLSKFTYKAHYRDVGVEHEVCAVLRVDGISLEDLKPDPEEVSEILAVEPEKVVEMTDVCPWLLQGMQLLLSQGT